MLRGLQYTFILCFFSLQVFGQLSQEEEFGKNRVQYHKDFKYWWKYETANFITYWNTPARKVAEAAILMAEKDYGEIQNLLEHHINDKIQIIVFRDLTDFKQSNLGSEEIFENKAGQTKVDGNRIFIYSNGDHSNLRHQIREGIASVHIAQMLQGSTIQELVQNAFLSALPPWYVPGLISYVGAPYNFEFEDDLRTYFEQYNYDDFETFGLEFPTLAGHAMWNYIYIKYGATNLSNLLYITRINRKLDNGFIYVLGVPFERVSQECYEYYRNSFLTQQEHFIDPVAQNIDIKKKKLSKRNKGVYAIRITDVQLSPDQGTLLYVTNEIGRYRAYLYDVKSKKQSKLLQGKFRNPFQEPDFGYPLFAWGRHDNELYGVEEKRDKIYLKHWDFRKGELSVQEFPPTIERIYSIDRYSKDTLLISASTDGQTDLYFYRPKTRQTYRITNDYFDNLGAKTISVAGAPYIVFSSNRNTADMTPQTLDTILPEQDYDLFLISPRTGIAQRLTQTPWASERNVSVVGSKIQYTSDQNGINNRWQLDVSADELKPKMLTQYKSGIDDFTQGEDLIIESLSNGRDATLRIVPDDYPMPETTFYTQLAKIRKGDIGEEEKISSELIPVPKQDEDFYFQSEFEDEIPLPSDFGQSKVNKDESLLILPNFSDLTSERDSRNGQEKFNSARMLAYRMTFGMTDFDIDLNNDLLFTGLNTYAGSNRGFEFPETGILMKTEMRDLFENYIVSGGARVPLSFRGTEFFLSVEDRKFQLDRKISIYRKSEKEKSDERFVGQPDTRNTTHIGVYQLNYPFSIFSSVRLTGTLRFDRTTLLPDEMGELNADNLNQQRIGLRLEYVFDNSYETLPNIRHGSRAKVYVEGMNRFQLQFDPYIFDANQAFMTTIGVDARHYIRLDRRSIFAFRAAGATSFGSERILYTLGGVKNWISADYNRSTPRPISNDFAFQAAANDMRGFRQNIRNGSTYVLGNVELRVPLFNYFSKKEIKSKFFRNFQVIGFFDAGTAWLGSSPNSEENLLNREILTNPVSQVDVRYFRDPLVLGYGAGLRLNLLGYFVRLDYAWGYETRQQTDPIFYFSLGHDF